MKAIKYEQESVLIQDNNIKVWVDIWIENNDVICDWNKSEFVLSNSKEVAIKNWQDNLEHFEMATNIAVDVLLNAGIIFQDENAKWHNKKVV